MYVLPETTDRRILFGDIFVADWLFDAWLEEDAERLGAFTAKGNNPAYGAHAASADADFLLAHARTPSAAMVMNDDCRIRTIVELRKEGRLMFAPIFPLPKNPSDRIQQLQSSAFYRLPLNPGDEFAGGTVDLESTFTVRLPNAKAVDRLRSHRIVRLDPRGRRLAEARWGAHSVRRGPVVAKTVSEKFLELLPECDPAAGIDKAIAGIVSHTWRTAGAIPDLIDTAAEPDSHITKQALVDELVRQLEELERDAGASAEQLRVLAAALTNAP